MGKAERSTRPPVWMRVLRIGIGAVSIMLSLIAIAYPGLAVESAVIVISIILIIIGIEHIAGGTMIYQNHRAAHIGIGILVIALASAAIVFPLFAAFVVIALAAAALLFSGISHILMGIGKRSDPGWAKATNIGAGVLAVVVSSIALISPFIGVFLLALMIAVALLVYGMRLIALGTVGYGQA